MIQSTQSSILISDVLHVKCGYDRVVKYGRMHGLPPYTHKAFDYQFTKNTADDYWRCPLQGLSTIVRPIVIGEDVSSEIHRRLEKSGMAHLPMALFASFHVNRDDYLWLNS